MPQWLRNLVMLLVLGMTLSFLVVGLVQNKNVPWEALGIPATTFVALAATKVKVGKGGVEIEKEGDDDNRPK